jgi:DNA-binding MarR family transcriptional regulator
MEQETLDRIEALLQSLVRLQAALLERDAFSSGKERLAYDMTGTASAQQICKAAKISATTLTELWARLEKMGLLKKDGSRYKKLTSE